MTSNNMGRHVLRHHPEHASSVPIPKAKASAPEMVIGTPATLPEGVAPRTAALAVSHYMDALGNGVGKRKQNGVSLGALAGFPTWTDDPEVVAAAVKVLNGRVPQERGLKRADLVERISQLENFEGGPGSNGQRELVLGCLKWVSENRQPKPPWSYLTLRKLGFTAKDLKQAGINQ